MNEGKPDMQSPADQEAARAAAEESRSAVSRMILFAVIESGFLGVGVMALIAERTTEGIALIVGGLVIGMMGVVAMVAARLKAQRLQQPDE